jgi:hypothetical protein
MLVEGEDGGVARTMTSAIRSKPTTAAKREIRNRNKSEDHIFMFSSSSSSSIGEFARI